MSDKDRQELLAYMKAELEKVKADPSYGIGLLKEFGMMDENGDWKPEYGGVPSPHPSCG